VPLYNYSSSADVYANFTEDVVIPWTTSINTITPTTSSLVDGTIFTLAIQNIPKPSYLFQFTSPIGLFISGNNSSTSDISGNISITEATLNVYYNGSTTPIYTKTITFSNSLSFTTTNISTTASSNFFQATQYIGNVTFSNIPLNTQYGYVYDFNINCQITNNTLDGNLTNWSNPVYGIYMNVDKTDKVNNCSITPQTNTVTNNYNAFNFSGQ
jgi:hypothetical protein